MVGGKAKQSSTPSRPNNMTPEARAVTAPRVFPLFTWSRAARWLVAGLSLFLLACEAEPPAEAAFVGSERCGSCHQDEHRRWRQSHHAMAMAPATADTVRGDFADSRFRYAGQETRFYRQDEQYWVETPGPDGELTKYLIRYTFGVSPLQQYLIAFPRGHYQALSIAWDDRPSEQGGQRWFHLYPDDAVTHDDPLFWTGPYHNWNSRCAECHSTGLEKNYELDSASYQTTWREISVGCEACHGAGSRHSAWAEAGANGKDKGLLAPLSDDRLWAFAEGPIAVQRVPAAADTGEVAVCARCHSRRSVIGPWQANSAYIDAHIPSLLSPPEYHADGQIQDEVFEAGSFWQSRMFHAGVVCSDCHEPHSGRLRAEGNGVCAQCHRADVFDSPAHHRHADNSSGGQCVNCHMPERNYMVIDGRRDHSFRIPDPWLSVDQDTPNACNHCHAEQSAEWAVAALERWGVTKPDAHRFSRLLALANGHGSEAPDARRTLGGDGIYPAIVRATALAQMELQSEADIAVLLKGLSDDDPLVRMGAVRAFQAAPPALRQRLLWPLLDEPVKAVRLEAVRLLSAVPADRLSDEQQAVYTRGLAEFIEAQQLTADFAGSWLNLAEVHVNRGDYRLAEQAYRRAIEREPAFIPALLNLADLYRMLERDAEARPLLERALTIAPDDAAVQFSYGLLLVRNRDYRAALDYLKRASVLAPAVARYSYVYAVALQSLGRAGEARAVAESALARHPGDRDLRELVGGLPES